MRRSSLLAIRSRFGFVALLCFTVACEPATSTEPDGNDPSNGPGDGDDPASGEGYPSAASVFGGQTSDGTGIAGSDDSLGDPCDVPSTSMPIDLDSVPDELSFSALDVVDWASVGVEESLTWAPDGQLETAPQSGEGRLSIEFVSTSDTAHLHLPAPHESGEPPPDQCGPWIEVDATATLVTEGGALDEQFPVQLRAARPFVVSFLGELPRQALAGDLEVSSSMGPGLEDELSVEGTLTAFGSHGRITVRIAADGLRLTVLRWPATSDCAENGTLASSGTDELFEHDVDALRDAFVDLDPLVVSWSDGGTSRVTIAAEPETPLCVSAQWWGGSSTGFFETTLAVSSEDDRWDATYAAPVRVVVDAEGRPLVLARVDVELPGERRDDLGLQDLPADSLDTVRLVLELERTLPDGEASGSLKVTGESDSLCEDLPVEEVDTCLAENQGIDLLDAEFGE